MLDVRTYVVITFFL